MAEDGRPSPRGHCLSLAAALAAITCTFTAGVLWLGWQAINHLIGA